MQYSNGRLNLDNQRVLVTGASRGLGAEIASSLAAAGAELMISGRDAIGLETTRQQVQQHGRACHVVQADLRCIDETLRLADKALEMFRTVDILVNNLARPIFTRAATGARNDQAKTGQDHQHLFGCRCACP